MEKTEVKVLMRVRKTVQESIIKTIEIELPTKHTFYHWFDDSRFFGRGDILFAILYKHKNYYSLYETERSIQDYTDFRVVKDCRQEDFLTSERSIRRTALDIIIGSNMDFIEITEERYLKIRDKLLNAPIKEALNN